MGNETDDIPSLALPVDEWVAKFFDGIGWPRTKASSPQIDTNSEAETAAKFEEIKARGRLLRANPPAGLPPENWIPVRDALVEFQTADKARDRERTKLAIAAVNRELDRVAAYPAVIENTELGYVWHAIDPPEKRQFAIGLRTGTSEHGDYPVVKVASLSSRPRGKHGGRQGQHLNAFVMLRETIVSTCHERTEEQARKNVRHQFKGLLNYPAFGPEGMKVGMDKDLLAKITDLSDENSEIWNTTTLAEAMAQFVEVREALPGASLAQGAVSDTWGHGEAQAVAKLSELEGEDFEDLTPDRAAEAARLMLRLVDRDAVMRLRADPKAHRHAMETAVLALVQAYPRILGGADAKGSQCLDMLIERANRQLAQELPKIPSGQKKDVDVYDPEGAFLASREQLADLTRRAKDCLLTDPCPPGSRPVVDNFTVNLDDKSKPWKLDVTGRPSKSLKEGSQMGDHTCAMRLMSTAISGVILQGKNAFPSPEEVSQRLKSVLETFAPRNYDNIYPPPPVPVKQRTTTPGGKEKMTYTDVPDPFVSYRKRLELMKTEVDTLKRLVEELGADPSSKATSGQISDAGEAILRLMDQRPTAVAYIGGTSKNKGEHLSGQECDLAERKLREQPAENEEKPKPKYLSEKECVELGANLLGLFDPGAARTTLDDINKLPKDKFSAYYEKYLARIVNEFVWFAEKAYPETVNALTRPRLEKMAEKAISAIDAQSNPRDREYIGETTSVPSTDAPRRSGRPRSLSRAAREAQEEAEIEARGYTAGLERDNAASTMPPPPPRRPKEPDGGPTAAKPAAKRPRDAVDAQEDDPLESGSPQNRRIVRARRTVVDAEEKTPVPVRPAKPTRDADGGEAEAPLPSPAKRARREDAAAAMLGGNSDRSRDVEKDEAQAVKPVDAMDEEPQQPGSRKRARPADDQEQEEPERERTFKRMRQDVRAAADVGGTDMDEFAMYTDQPDHGGDGETDDPMQVVPADGAKGKRSRSSRPIRKPGR